jgi:hypothetical protein
MPTITDETLGAVVRAIVREAALEVRTAWISAAADGTDESGPTPPAGLEPHDTKGFAIYVLEQEGAPLHVLELEEYMYALGFKPKKELKYEHQTASTLNSYAAPSRQPSELMRVRPRTLALKKWGLDASG